MSQAFDEPDVRRVRALLAAMVGRRVAVVGDSMLDAYVVGQVSRISPEAPVPVLNVQDEQFMLGGAANVAKCLVALGAQVRLCTVVGRDGDGELFISEAKNLGVSTSGVLADAHRPTTRKTRIIARQQQVIRLDRETIQPLTAAVERRLIARVRQAARWADALILSDYSKGVLTDAVCRAAIQAAGAKPVLVDPKDLPWTRYRGATIIKPNVREAEAFAGCCIDDDAAAARCAMNLARQLDLQHVLITRGKHGMTMTLNHQAARAAASADRAVTSAKRASTPGSSVRRRRQVVQLAARPRDLVDVTGAGDVVSATLALALAGGAQAAEAAWLANVAAGIKVGKFGAATVTGQEILEALGSGESDCQRKVMSRRQAAGFAQNLRKAGRKVVFTNGCFDLLHVGHVSYLERSRRLGDALIVGVNTDASVRRLKGEGRPVQHENDRAHIIASLGCVDAVVLFDEDTPLALIRAVKPDVLAKGADYKRKQNVVGWDVVEKAGGRVVLVELVEGRSTTSLLHRARH